MHQDNNDDYVVESNSRRMVINPVFLKKHGAEGNLEEIKRTFALKFHLMDLMDKLEDEPSLRVMDRALQDLEFRIQELFNFTPDRNFHRFWERPHCLCPKMDNQDSWGTGHAIFNMGCPLHGKKEEIKEEERRLFESYRRDEFVGEDSSRDSD